MRRNILLIIQILTYAQLAYSAIVTDTTVDDRREYFQHGGFSNFVYLLTSTKEKHKFRNRNKIGNSKQILLFLSFQSMSRLSPEYSMIDFIVTKMTKEKPGPPGLA